MLIGEVTHMWLQPEKTFSNAMLLTKLTGILAYIFRSFNCITIYTQLIPILISFSCKKISYGVPN